MSDVPVTTLEERLASLEERTRPRPKTVLDHIKDWSGVATACIALLYTIPLGVWDYWVKSPQSRDTDALRTAIVQIADLEARGVQGFASISNSQAQLVYTSAIGAQRAALLARVQPLIEGRRAALSVPELTMLARNLGEAGFIDSALAVFANAIEVAERELIPLQLRADIHRLVGQLHATASDSARIVRVRDSYRRNLRMMIEGQTLLLQQYAGNSAFEWAFFEKVLPGGNWACADFLQAWAVETLTPLMPLNPAVGATLENYRLRLGSIPNPGTAERQICPEDAVAVLRAARGERPT